MNMNHSVPSETISRPSLSEVNKALCPDLVYVYPLITSYMRCGITRKWDKVCPTN
jgi:hypothetical protein